MVAGVQQVAQGHSSAWAFALGASRRGRYPVVFSLLAGPAGSAAGCLARACTVLLGCMYIASDLVKKCRRWSRFWWLENWRGLQLALFVRTMLLCAGCYAGGAAVWAVLRFLRPGSLRFQNIGTNPYLTKARIIF